MTNKTGSGPVPIQRTLLRASPLAVRRMLARYRYLRLASQAAITCECGKPRGTQALLRQAASIRPVIPSSTSDRSRPYSK